ncbi:3',5'-cyclic adenosine monophosphate phosphodiesterase CpdA [Prochlorococcus marinus str. MIT 1342]|uniref:metallophosphoesterase n=1 Tax=Prochlorococcus TaxID=1218 RepID=UPI0007B3C665|nr:metallophosphoesterase [Prochlorococcus marinus]KZR83873.1 3',5'-cyclic adenosine monophosphate phosphodiesterase CpdA [Prochlorococcus marinus str. MIT 1342]
MRLVQLSDPHLVAFNQRLVRGKNPLLNFQYALQHGASHSPDLLLITGDLCHDETWCGYVLLRHQLQNLSPSIKVAVLPGNHDNPLFIKAALGRHAFTAPADLNVDGVRLILLSSHVSGRTAGQLGESQLQWLDARLSDFEQSGRPLVVAVHHPPLPIGSSWLDAIGLVDGEALIKLLTPVKELCAVVCGHIHQHWQGGLPGRKDVLVLGCPSTLCSFKAVQPCLLGREDEPGGRLIELDERGNFFEKLLRWSYPDLDQADVGR